jgi:hypothetical protein
MISHTTSFYPDSLIDRVHGPVTVSSLKDSTEPSTYGFEKNMGKDAYSINALPTELRRYATTIGFEPMTPSLTVNNQILTTH